MSSWVQPLLDVAREWLLLRAWSLYKFALHRWTGQSELERIARATPSTASADQLLQQQLDLSDCMRRSAQLYPTVAPIYGTTAMQRKRQPAVVMQPVASDADEEKAAGSVVRSVVRVKAINEDELTTQLQVMPALTATLSHVLSVNRLLAELEAGKTPYSESNVTHEKLLMKLWDLLRPAQPLSARKSNDWEQLGFQGDNPATDFRGMGTLGLYNLVAFASTCGLDATRLLADCNRNGLRWYSFAITGINLTADLIRLTRERVLDNYYFKHGATVQSFNALYCAFFVRFNEAWTRANPMSVMEFSHIHDAFLVEVRRQAPYAHRVSEGYEYLAPLVPVEKFEKQKWH